MFFDNWYALGQLTMKKLTRYVLFELTVAFLITLTGITVLLIFAVLVKEATSRGLALDSIMRMLPYTVPIALQLSLPATILIAVCSVFGRMSADNEIVAIKSLGISPFSMVMPALMLGSQSVFSPFGSTTLHHHGDVSESLALESNHWKALFTACWNVMGHTPSATFRSMSAVSMVES